MTPEERARLREAAETYGLSEIRDHDDWISHDAAVLALLNERDALAADTSAEAWVPAVGSVFHLPPVGSLRVLDHRFGRVICEDAWGRRHTYSLWWLRDIRRRGWKGAA